MKDKTKEITGFIAGVIVSTIASWFASLFVFQKFILKGQQSSMGFEYIPVLFGTPVLAVLVFAGLFVSLTKLNLALRLSLSLFTPILVCIGATVVLYKVVFNY